MMELFPYYPTVRPLMNQPAKPITSAMTLTEVLALIAILAVLAVLLLPMLRTRRVIEDWGSCINHLKFTGVAFREWAEDNGGGFPMQLSITNGGTMAFVTSSDAAAHFAILSNYLNTPTVVWCPGDTGRTRARDFSTQFSNSNISYFVGRT